MASFPCTLSPFLRIHSRSGFISMYLIPVFTHPSRSGFISVYLIPVFTHPQQIWLHFRVPYPRFYASPADLASFPCTLSPFLRIPSRSGFMSVYLVPRFLAQPPDLSSLPRNLLHFLAPPAQLSAFPRTLFRIYLSSADLASFPCTFIPVFTHPQQIWLHFHVPYPRFYAPLSEMSSSP